MNPEQSLKQRSMLIAYHESRKNIDWPTLECAMLMLKIANGFVTKARPPKTPCNTPAG